MHHNPALLAVGILVSALDDSAVDSKRSSIMSSEWDTRYGIDTWRSVVVIHQN